MSLLDPLFLSADNLLNTSRFFVEVGLMALGMTLIIITGGIDLSVGSNLALVSVAVGFSYAAGLPLPLAIVFGLVVGVAAGLFNGLFITLLDLHPLVVTLGTLALFQGLAYGHLERPRRSRTFPAGSRTSARPTSGPCRASSSSSSSRWRWCG